MIYCEILKLTAFGGTFLPSLHPLLCLFSQRYQKLSTKANSCTVKLTVDIYRAEGPQNSYTGPCVAVEQRGESPEHYEKRVRFDTEAKEWTVKNGRNQSWTNRPVTNLFNILEVQVNI